MSDKIPYEELMYLKLEIFDKIRDSLPTDLANPIFTAFKRLYPTDTMSQPCTCSSAGRYWKDIIDRSRVEIEKQMAEHLATPKEDINVTPAKKGKRKSAE